MTKGENLGIIVGSAVVGFVIALGYYFSNDALAALAASGDISAILAIGVASFELTRRLVGK